MRLRVLVPSKVLITEEVTKINAEGGNGVFCLLPRHIDFVSALVPGLLTFVKEDGLETVIAVSEGTLVKQGEEVLVSVRRAIRGGELDNLRQKVEDEFKVLDEREKKARSAAAKIEADFIRRYLEMKEQA
jgi:F-type H+-transporting ATPase subunit epsilon